MRRDRLSATNLARLGHFPPASQAGQLAGRVFYVHYMYFLWVYLKGDALVDPGDDVVEEPGVEGLGERVPG